MPEKEFFPQRPEIHPMIYAYEELNPGLVGLLKVGYTEVDIDKRVAQQYPVKRPDGKLPYRIVLRESAMFPDGSSFTDHDVHRMLIKKKVIAAGGEWFRCSVEELKAAIIAVKIRLDNVENRHRDFKMRPEQEQAIRKTAEYFQKARSAEPSRSPKFLWNAKMRFGKTFATYQLAKHLGFKKILVLTFKPAVESAWEEDLKTHIDFEGWQFITREGLNFEQADINRPIVCFGSFQDYLGTNEVGGIKTRNEWVHTTNWDLVVFDEYHFGAWRDNAKSLFDKENEDEYDTLDFEKYKREEADNAYNESFLPITTMNYLFLSGTPFRAMHSGEFIEDQIYSWTYSDEQRAKENWIGQGNPYLSLPRMVLLTYKMPDSIRHIALQGEFDEFDLNVFFSAKGKGKEASFVYDEYVQKWLDLIRGAYMPTTIDDLKLGRNEKPAMPYSDTRLLNVLSHTLWFLPNVAACYAMKNLLLERQNTFYHDYKINVAAGVSAGIGVKALTPVLRSMGDPIKTKTITLSCGKLTTGVTVRPWTGIFMLRNLSTPETYFQAAFRVQSPWDIFTESGSQEVLKKECYIFDFALDRALRQIADYSRSLNTNESNPEKKVREFINFLPVLAYDGSTMKEIDASEILDITMAGTSATLLARRWESAMLVNVDNDTLKRLMENDEAMAALEKIEAFRSLKSDIETIINKSEAVKKAKKESGDNLTKEDKRDLTKEEKEYKSKRKEIQEKLIKFATRIPVFMYLTDFREHSMHDVITQLEPQLFKKVTGLDVKDFYLLASLNVFNREIMNDAVYKFRRYEDSSLSYTGINKHQGQSVGLYDTVLSREDYERLSTQQSGSMSAPPYRPIDPTGTPFTVDSDDEEKEEAAFEIIEKSKKRRGRQNPINLNPIRVMTKQVTPFASLSKSQSNSIDSSLLKVGASVNHKTFGEGTIVEVNKDTVFIKFSEEVKKIDLPSISNEFLSID